MTITSNRPSGRPNDRPNKRLALAVLVGTFVGTLVMRTWAIDSRSWMLFDQMRDWSIALGSFGDLPLVGPATHVHGYTIGPAFYWILWLLRVWLGPWFDNLPHAGGIGQAVLMSLADALLLLAVWRRTHSLSTGLATIVVLSAAAFDLTLSAVVWNPIVGSILARFSTALVLLDWHRGSTVRRVVLAAVAWAAVHAYTGAVYVTVSVFAAMLLEPLVARDWRGIRRNVLVIVAVVGVLQVPYLVHQFLQRFSDPAMGAVTGGVMQILTGAARPEFEKSLAGYVGAVSFIELAPWSLPRVGWLLLASSVVTAVRYRFDIAVLTMTVLPSMLAVLGYAMFLGGLDHYYYFSVMPAAVLTVLLAATAMPQRTVAHAVGLLLLAGAVAISPARIRYSTGLHWMREYGPLVQGSRVIARRGLPMRAIQAEFRLPPTGDLEYVYRILGGQIDRSSPWVATIGRDGTVTYEDLGGV